MSVILDALKRVQDENTRRGVTPDGPPQPKLSSNAMLRGMAGKEPYVVEERRQLSPAFWVAIIALTSIAIVATALWWFQPDLRGARSREGRPLLTEGGRRSTQSTPNAGARAQMPVAAAQGYEPNTAPAGAVSAPVRETGPRTPTASAATTTSANPRTGAARGADLSDLSGNLRRNGESTMPAAANTVAAAPAEAESSGGSIRLEVQQRDPSREPVAQVTPAQESFGNQSSSGFDAGDSAVEARGDLPSGLVDPGVRAAFDEGVRMQKAGQHYRAEEAYKRALKFDPHNAKVNANMGVLYEATSRLSLAERHLRQALAVEPDNAAAHNNLGVVLYRMGNYDGALIEFNRTLALDATRLDAYTNKGLIFTRWGKLQDAERAFLQVLAIDPDNALAHYNVGLVYEEQDRFDAALSHYYRFLEVGGADFPEVASYLGKHLPWLQSRADGPGAARS